MNASIITIGDELLIGQVIDTNSAWMGKELNKLGIDVRRKITIGDGAEEIKQALDIMLSCTDIVLITGGIGPTKDDVTKQTLCQYFQTKLIWNQQVYDHIEQMLSKRNFPINELTRNQAYVPENCTVLKNGFGTAPITWFDHKGKIIVSMPGVPMEMQQVMQDEILPRLAKQANDNHVILHHTLIVIGYGESLLAEKLISFEEELAAEETLAYLPDAGLVRLRLSIRGTNQILVEQKTAQKVTLLHNILGKHIVVDEDLTLSKLVGIWLQKRGMTLSTAESCTGGNVAHLITLEAGASTYFKGSIVAYSNEVKMHLLGVKKETLESTGAVSEKTVLQMVNGCCQVLETSCGIALSGIAGPDGGTPEKPTGTVWIAVRCGDKVTAKKEYFQPYRPYHILRSSNAALLMLLEMLIDQN